MKRLLITHITTVRLRTDTRIRVKEAASLASDLNHQVVLFVQDGNGHAGPDRHGVQIKDIGPRHAGRLARMVVGSWRMYRAVRRARPKLVHLHDPELIPIALLLKIGGAKIIYDVHEDVPRQILGKGWLPGWSRRPVVALVEGLEGLATKTFDGVVAATPTIGKRFPAGKTVTVQNFPIEKELVAPEPVPTWSGRHTSPMLVALLQRVGAPKWLRQFRGCRTRLSACNWRGSFPNPIFMRRREGCPAGPASTSIVGPIEQPLRDWLGAVRAGLVLFSPAPNHMNAQPNKLFEYLAAGLPVIASDFPLWRKIVQGAECGVLVDSLDPSAIADAMQWILDHPEEAEAMGQRGRATVESTYNWTPEAEKLIGLYHRIIGQDVETQSKETRYGDR